MHDTGTVVKGNCCGSKSCSAPKSPHPPLRKGGKTVSIWALLCLQAVAQGVCCRFGAVGGAGLGENVADVRGNRVEADAEGVGNLPIALPGRHQA